MPIGLVYLEHEFEIGLPALSAHPVESLLFMGEGAKSGPTSGMPDILYHYTSIAGLHGIVRDKFVWATRNATALGSIARSVDPIEGSYCGPMSLQRSGYSGRHTVT